MPSSLGRAKSGALSFISMNSTRVFKSVAILLIGSALATAAAYQHHASHKLRATALLELTTDHSGTVSARIIPIAILDQGRFHDASIYESKPRPMALQNGVVYEAQKSGTPVGYVTITSGEHAQDTWIASGKWQSVGQVAAAAAPRPTPPPAPSPADERPILHRGGDNSPRPSQSPGSDGDRPVLHRSEGSQSDQSPSGSSSSSSSTDNSSSPDEGPTDPNRPVLRRRTPASQPSPPPTPQSTPAGSATAPTQTVTSPPAVSTTPGTQTYVAVSDAQATETRSFDYIWKPGEREQVEAKMRKLALAQLPGESTQTNEHSMTNVVIRGFDLDLSNEAVVVLTAELPGAYLAKGSPSSPGKFVSRYITLIARVDMEGNPQRLAVSVGDSSRLDVAPRLELIDAVDVDGDGLAELLFREYGVDQKTFIIYGIGRGTVTKVFEGASQSLK